MLIIGRFLVSVRITPLVALVAIIFLPIDLPAQQPPSTVGDEAALEQTQVTEGVVTRIDALVTAGSLNVDLVTGAKAVLNELLETTRADQNSIYSFVRVVNINIDEIDCLAGNPSSRGVAECLNFQESVRNINRELMISSYTDALFQNANLSNQIKIRLPLLIEDSLKLTGDNAEYLREYFLDELNTLSRRFLDTRRFRAGLGLEYSYLPKISHTAAQRVDLSPFQSVPAPRRQRDNLLADFSNTSFASLVLSARVPYVQIDAVFPNSEVERVDATPIQLLADPSREIFFRSTITSKLDIEYELSVRVSLSDFFQADGRAARHHGGIGVGLTGFDIEDTGVTDIRFRTNGMTTPFDDLPPGETIESAEKNSFNNPFLFAFYSVEISDTLQVGVELRAYDSDTSSGSEVAVDDVTVSIGATWYPTFSFGMGMGQ